MAGSSTRTLAPTWLRTSPQTVATHAVLIVAVIVALGPTLLIVLNSFKDRVDVFTRP
jgi:ABC-type glycerol-3-phosphate transport system permease component